MTKREFEKLKIGDTVYNIDYYFILAETIKTLLKEDINGIHYSYMFSTKDKALKSLLDKVIREENSNIKYYNSCINGYLKEIRKSENKIEKYKKKYEVKNI